MVESGMNISHNELQADVNGKSKGKGIGGQKGID